MTFGTRGQLSDVITCVKFLVDRFRGYGVLTPPKLPFPTDLMRRPYNSVRIAVRHCDYKMRSRDLTTPSLGVSCHAMANTRCTKYYISLFNRSEDINGFQILFFKRVT